MSISHPASRSSNSEDRQQLSRTDESATEPTDERAVRPAEPHEDALNGSPAALDTPDDSDATAGAVRTVAIPDVSGMSPCDAALAYAKAGIYVLPITPGTKKPDSVVGNQWQRKSSRDPAQIKAWWGKNPGYGVAIHPGRSGLVIFDMDKDSLDELPPEWAEGLRLGMFQRSRAGDSDRGHYVFSNGGLHYQDKAKAFGPYGQIRSRGVVVVEPSKHVKPEGEYRWMGSGRAPVLPKVLAEILSRSLSHAPADEVPAMSEGELQAFLENPEHTRQNEPERLNGPRNWFVQQVEAGVSIHDSIVDVLCWALREVRVGAYAAADVIAVFQTEFHEAFASEYRGVGDRHRPAPEEFSRALAWAAAQVKNEDLGAIRRRMDRDKFIDEEAFWNARPELSQLRQAAQSRLMAPWSVFGCAIARAVAVIPPTVMLPEVIGSRTGLNLFVGLVGISGDGKGSSHSVVKDFLRTEPPVYQVNLGTGEGIAREYARKSGGEQVGIRNSVLFSVNEIDRLASLLSRSGATLGSVIREAWSGEKLGFANKNDENRFNIEDHRYRMVMTVGIQPERSQVLFESEDGGTPQRFLWLPAWDPNVSDDDVPEPSEVTRLPRWPGKTRVVTQEDAPPNPDDKSLLKLNLLNLDKEVERHEQQVLGVPDRVRKILRDNKRKQHRRESKTLDGHALLTRLKVAAALMWMNGRTDEITEEDWTLAGVVMAVSDQTRDNVRRDLAGAQRKRNTARGRARAEQDHAAENHSATLKDEDDALVTVAAERVLTVLRGNGGEMPWNKLAKACGRTHKPYLRKAVKSLSATGGVTVEDTEYHGKSGQVVRLNKVDE